jgi:hypothetical protein
MEIDQRMRKSNLLFVVIFAVNASRSYCSNIRSAWSYSQNEAQTLEVGRLPQARVYVVSFTVSLVMQPSCPFLFCNRI